MPKKATKKQPADDPQLKEEVSDAVADAGDDTGNVATASEPDATVSGDTLHLRDIRPE